MSKEQLAGADLSGCDLSDVDLSNAHMEDTNLARAVSHLTPSADVSEDTESGFVYESKGHTRRRQHRRLCDVRHRQLKAVLKAAAAEGCAQDSKAAECVPKIVLKAAEAEGCAQGSKACRGLCSTRQGSSRRLC